MRRLLVSADLVGLSAAFALASLLAASTSVHDRLGWATELIIFLATFPLWVIFAKLHHLYDHDGERTDHSTPDDIPGIIHLVTFGSWLVLIACWLTHLAKPDIRRIVAFWGFAILFVAAARAGARMIARRHATYVENVVIVGAGRVGYTIARKIAQHPEYGLRLRGFVDSDPMTASGLASRFPVLGGPHDLLQIIASYRIHRVIVAFSSEDEDTLIALVRSLKDSSVHIDIVPRLFEVVAPGMDMHSVEGLPLVALPPSNLARSSQFLKRMFDLALVIPVTLVLMPLIGVIAAWVRLDSPGPAFFKQTRMGARGPFTILKFRTMVADAEALKAGIAHLNMHAVAGGDPRMFKVPNDPRVTHAGGVLRRYSLDELPQLINVLRGDMSLVGPRPLILEEDQHLAVWARRRLNLKPGITGLWQVLGRSGIPFDEMTRLDYLYVANWSLWQDLRLLLRTIPLVFRPRGVV